MFLRKTGFLRLTGLAFTCLLGGCEKRLAQAVPAPAQASRGTLVARVGDAEIRDDDLTRALARDPGATSRTAEARRDLVEGLVRFELLAQAAERAGFTRDPDAVHALKQIAVTKFVNRELGPASSPETVTKEEIEREYAARQATEFTRPEAARVRHIRVGDESAAKRIVTSARALAPEDDAGFAKLAASLSLDSLARVNGGDLGYVDKDARLARPLLEAVQKLRSPGEVAGPVKTDDGYEILRLVSRRSSAVSSLGDVEELIRQRLYQKRRADALEALIARLRRQTAIEVTKPSPTSR